MSNIEQLRAERDIRAAVVLGVPLKVPTEIPSLDVTWTAADVSQMLLSRLPADSLRRFVLAALSSLDIDTRADAETAISIIAASVANRRKRARSLRIRSAP